jgi:hypothetical protein
MCDDITKSQCCILNPLASITTCTASGGKISTDPCNVLNPIADKSVCTAKGAVQPVVAVTGGSLSGLAIFGIVILIIVVVLILLSVVVFGGIGIAANASQSTPIGGSKHITKFIKRLFGK